MEKIAEASDPPYKQFHSGKSMSSLLPSQESGISFILPFWPEYMHFHLLGGKLFAYAVLYNRKMSGHLDKLEKCKYLL